ncbi:MAG: FAD-dependent oxidoreductase [Planctomycetota bacterium]
MRGHDIMLVERHARPRGATVRNFGQVTPSGLDTRWQTFRRRSLEIYKELQSQQNLTVCQHCSIYITSDDEESTLLHEMHAINWANGYDSQMLTAAQCRQRYPNLRGDYVRCGLLYPQEMSVDPRQMIHRLQNWLSHCGKVRLQFGTQVNHLDPAGEGQSDHAIAWCSNGTRIAARHIILCCGHEFGTLFPERFQHSDIQRVRLQMLRLRPTPGITMPGDILTDLSVRFVVQ